MTRTLTGTDRKIRDRLVKLGIGTEEAARIASNPAAMKKLGELLDAAVRAPGITPSGVAAAALKSAGMATDPDYDPQGLQVAKDGNGNWIVVDAQTGATVGQVTFGDAVAQAATKAAGSPTAPADYHPDGRRTKASLRAERAQGSTTRDVYDLHGRHRIRRDRGGRS